MTVETGPKALQGTDGAKRLLALLLEALGGIRSTQEAADGMGVALVRYYQLETRALQAMLDALEPRQKGRKPKTEAQYQAEFAEEKQMLLKDLNRYKSLCRSLQRTVGVTPPEPPTPGGPKKKTRRIRKVNRGEKVVAAMLGPQSEKGPSSKEANKKKEKAK